MTEDILLSWFAETLQWAPSQRRAGSLLKGLEMFLDYYLIDRGKLEVNLATELLRRDSRRHQSRIARIVAKAGTCDVNVLKARLASLDRFRSGLKDDFLGCLEYLEAQKLVVAPYARAFGRFDRILLQRGVERSEDITSEALVDFLTENEVAPATRNQRLVRVRRFFQYLVRQGRELTVPWEQFKRVTVPVFRPHIYSLKEIDSILSFAREQSYNSRDPILWEGLELVLFLCTPPA